MSDYFDLMPFRLANRLSLPFFLPRLPFSRRSAWGTTPGAAEATGRGGTPVPGAAEATGPSWIDAWLDAPGLTGTWSGLRDDLLRRGITPLITYSADVVGNPIGGRRRGSAYAGQVNADFTFDLEKLAGLDGLIVNVSANWAAGRDQLVSSVP